MQFGKIYTSPAIEFLLHTVEAIRKLKQVKKNGQVQLNKCRNNIEMQKWKWIGKKYRNPANKFLLHTVESIGKWKKVE